MIKLFEKQLNAVHYLKDKVTTEVVFGGSAGGGKSALGCLWLMEMCQSFPGTRWLMGRSKLKTLKETTLNTFFQLASKLEISDQFEYKEQAGIIVWDNGSEIILKDLFLYPSDPEFDSLGSLEITGAFVDEISQIVYKAWQIVKSRIRYRLDEYNLHPKMLGTCNPSKGWVFNSFYKPTVDKNIEGYRVFIQSLPTDNPYLPETYLQSLLELDESSKRRLYYGDWTYEDDPKVLISLDSVHDAYTNQYIQPSPNRYISADVAFLGSDKFVITVWYGMVVKEVYAMDKSDHQQVIRTIQSMQVKHRVRMSNTVFDGDGTGNYVGSFLRGAVSFKNGGTPKHPRKNDLVQYKNLKSQCYFKLADCINRGEILIEDEAYKDKIIEELSSIRNYSHGTDMKLSVMPKEKWKELLGRSPDFADSFMMRMYFEVGKQNKNGRVLNKY